MKKIILYILGIIYILFAILALVSDGLINGTAIIFYVTGAFLFISGIIKIFIDGGRDMRFKKNKEEIKPLVTLWLFLGGIVLISAGNYIFQNLSDTTKLPTDNTEILKDSLPKKKKAKTN